jgi:dihydrofolate reductase
MIVSLLYAQAQNGVIGRQGGLPWHLAADLKHFKQLTMGHTIVMGRKTFNAIGRALPGRRSIVLSRNPQHLTDTVRTLTSLQDALDITCAEGEVFVIGGAEILRLALPRATRIYRTLVHADVEGDVRFPDLSEREWRVARSDYHDADDANQFPMTFQELERI